jgi:glycosyltransferase involved in cell wall biosynthesis
LEKQSKDGFFDAEGFFIFHRDNPMSSINKNHQSDNIDRSGFAIVIPVYNHGPNVKEVILKALKLNMPIFVVDDGSNDDSYDRIKQIKNINILRHNVNMGKGAALLTGFAKAAEIADWAVTLDADGQHDPLDAILMIRGIQNKKRPIIVGMRTGMMGPEVPWTSRFGRKFSNFWVKVAGGPFVKDSQSGFRIYPLPEILGLKVVAKRFQFEVEALVKAGWKGMPVCEIPISVNYQQRDERISHFRPWIDFVRNSMTFARLIFQRLLIPQAFRKKW